MAATRVVIQLTQPDFNQVPIGQSAVAAGITMVGRAGLRGDTQCTPITAREIGVFASSEP